MNGYNENYSEKGHYSDEPEPGSFVRAFDAFRKRGHLFLSSLPTPTSLPYKHAPSSEGN